MIENTKLKHLKTVLILSVFFLMQGNTVINAARQCKNKTDFRSIFYQKLPKSPIVRWEKGERTLIRSKTCGTVSANPSEPTPFSQLSNFRYRRK